MMQSNFTTLKLAIKLHLKCQKLKMKSYLKDQLERASSSVALNLSEGNARHTTADRKKFFVIAYASLKEVEVVLMLCGLENSDVHRHVHSVGGSIYRLIQRCH